MKQFSARNTRIALLRIKQNLVEFEEKIAALEKKLKELENTQLLTTKKKKEVK